MQSWVQRTFYSNSITFPRNGTTRVIALFSKYVSSDHYENADTTHFESLVLLCKISPTWEAEKYLVPYWNGDGKE